MEPRRNQFQKKPLSEAEKIMIALSVIQVIIGILQLLKG